MPDDTGTRLRNVSDYGDIEVPDLGLIVPSKHETVVADPDLAQRLIDTGAFIAVGKPGPKTDTGSSSSSSSSGSDSAPPTGGDATTTTAPTGDATDTTTGEEPTSDHAA